MDVSFRFVLRVAIFYRKTLNSNECWIIFVKKEINVITVRVVVVGKNENWLNILVSTINNCVLVLSFLLFIPFFRGKHNCLRQVKVQTKTCTPARNNIKGWGANSDGKNIFPSISALKRGVPSIFRQKMGGTSGSDMHIKMLVFAPSSHVAKWKRFP